MEMEDSCTLITGAGVRLGRAIAKTMAPDSTTILLHYRQSSDAAEELAEELRTSGHRADTVAADLSTEEGCTELMDQAAEFGPITGLVNNAAVYNRVPLTETTEEVLLDELRPNLFAPLTLTRLFATQTKRGTIINLLDRRVAGLDSGALAYNLSKKSLADLTQLAALECGPGIRVNAVAPGPVLPPPECEDPNYMEEHGGAIVTEKRCSPEDIAHAVKFLFDAPCITGQILYVDSGQHLL